MVTDPPEKIVFGGDNLDEEEEVTVQLKITNPLPKRVAVKIKCTSNEMFRIRPPVFELMSRQTTTLTYCPGWDIPGKHIFYIYYITSKGRWDGRVQWSRHKGEAEGVRQIHVEFDREVEEDFNLLLIPNEKIVFSGNRTAPAVEHLRVINFMNETVAIKVQCTSREMFRVQKSFFALGPGDDTHVEIQFNPVMEVPESGIHHFVVNYIVAKDHYKSAKELWSEHEGEADGSMDIYVEFDGEGEAKSPFNENPFEAEIGMCL